MNVIQHDQEIEGLIKARFITFIHATIQEMIKLKCEQLLIADDIKEYLDKGYPKFMEYFDTLAANKKGIDPAKINAIKDYIKAMTLIEIQAIEDAKY